MFGAPSIVPAVGRGRWFTRSGGNKKRGPDQEQTGPLWPPLSAITGMPSHSRVSKCTHHQQTSETRALFFEPDIDAPVDSERG